MGVDKGEVTNEALKEELAKILQPMPAPITNGQFNRYIFINVLAVKAGLGVGMEADEIIKHTGMSEREFVTVKDEYVAKGIVEAKKNMFDVVLYSLCLT